MNPETRHTLSRACAHDTIPEELREAFADFLMTGSMPVAPIDRLYGKSIPNLKPWHTVTFWAWECANQPNPKGRDLDRLITVLRVVLDGPGVLIEAAEKDNPDVQDMLDALLLA